MISDPKTPTCLTHFYFLLRPMVSQVSSTIEVSFSTWACDHMALKASIICLYFYQWRVTLGCHQWLNTAEYAAQLKQPHSWMQSPKSSLLLAKASLRLLLTRIEDMTKLYWWSLMTDSCLKHTCQRGADDIYLPVIYLSLWVRERSLMPNLSAAHHGMDYNEKDNTNVLVTANRHGKTTS